MKKGIVYLAMLSVCSALCAQQSATLSKEDMLAAFELYNPTVLENAQKSEAYQNILQQLLDTYSIERTAENEVELIALVKNFDNSLALYLIKQQYTQGRQLHDMSGMILSNLEQNLQSTLESVLTRIHQNTLEVKKIQLKMYKEALKKAKKDAALSAEEKEQQVTLYKEKINQVKQEIKQLKTDSKTRIHATARAYLENLKAEYESAMAQQLSAAESANQDIKSNHKKPVAQ